jgi:hypothetical protein
MYILTVELLLLTVTLTNDKPALSSERDSHGQNSNYLVMSTRCVSTPRPTDLPSSHRDFDFDFESELRGP